MAKDSYMIVILIAAGVLIYLAATGGLGGNQPQTNQQNGGNIITTNPTIAVAAADAQSAGTSVGTSLQYSFDGGAFVTTPTTAVPGQKIDILVSNSSGAYHAAVVEGLTVTPSSFPVKVLMNKNASVTENIYSTTGVVINNGAGDNQTDLGNGASYNFKDEMTATSLASTQDMTCVLELTLGSNATTSPAGATLALNGAALPIKSTATPVWYSVAGVNSRVYVYDVPALSSSATQVFTIGVNAKATGRFTAGSKVIKTCYTKEWFVEPTTGKLAYDVADSLGTAKSIASYTDTIYFK